MTPKEAMEHALEYFDQRATSASAGYWEYNETTKELIAAGLRAYVAPEARLTDESWNKLKVWLDNREEDIVYGIEDFGDLYDVFREIFGRIKPLPQREGKT